MIRRLFDWLLGPRPARTEPLTPDEDNSGEDGDHAAVSGTGTRTAAGGRSRSGPRSESRGGAQRAAERPGATRRSSAGANGNRNGSRVVQAAAEAAGVHRVEHQAGRLGLKAEDISRAALKTCEGLQEAGFEAYVVGGGVRDSMLGLQPKDFDVATNATPAEVQRVFRRSRLIGRRFQIVHVLFGRETIEVSTFRAMQQDAKTDEHGRVLNDNVFGSQEEDALRRDFTINALYFDPVAGVIVDYLDGVKDLHARRLRMIGEPVKRYREDPVRMLRTIRFAAKLDFAVDPRTIEPIRTLGDLLANVPAARLFDEMLKLLQSGYALECLRRLRAEGLHRGVLPLLDPVVEGDERFITLALEQTDRRVHSGKSVSPSFLFATLLWQQVRSRWQTAIDAGELPHPALSDAIDSVIDEQAGTLAIQRRYQSDMREIWMMQPRLEKRGRGAHRMLEHLRFRAGYDFLLLRCESGEVPMEVGQWWTEFIDADGQGREALLKRVTGSSPSPRKRRRRRGRSGDSNPDSTLDSNPESIADSDRHSDSDADTDADTDAGADANADDVPVRTRGTHAAAIPPAGNNARLTNTPDVDTPPARSMPAAAAPKVTAYIGLGANLGDARHTISIAARALESLADTTVTGQSRVYRSDPVGAEGPEFFNQVVQVRTTQPPEALLDALHAIEQRFGRERSYRNAPRTLDLDLLLYGDRIIDGASLSVPHPRLHERLFVLLPLQELAPELRIPGRHSVDAHLREIQARGEQRCVPVEP